MALKKSEKSVNSGGFEPAPVKVEPPANVAEPTKDAPPLKTMAQSEPTQDLPVLKTAASVAVSLLLAFGMLLVSSIYLSINYFVIDIVVKFWVVVGAFYLGSLFKSKKNSVYTAAAYSAILPVGHLILMGTILLLLGFTLEAVLPRILGGALVFWVIKTFGWLVVSVPVSLAGNLAAKRFNIPRVNLLKPLAVLFVAWFLVLTVYASTGSEDVGTKEAGFNPLKACEQLPVYENLGQALENKSAIVDLVEPMCYNIAYWFGGESKIAEKVGVVFTPEAYFETSRLPRNEVVRGGYDATTVMYGMMDVSTFGLIQFWVGSFAGEYLEDGKPSFLLEQPRHFDAFNVAIGGNRYKDALIACSDNTYESYSAIEKSVGSVYDDLDKLAERKNMSRQQLEAKLGPKKLLFDFLEDQKKFNRIIRDSYLKSNQDYTREVAEDLDASGFDVASLVNGWTYAMQKSTVSTTLDICKAQMNMQFSRLWVNGTYRDDSRIYLEMKNTGHADLDITGLLVNDKTYYNTSCNGELAETKVRYCDFEPRNASGFEIRIFADNLQKQFVINGTNNEYVG